MWNNNQNALTELQNGQACLNNEPNYQQQIQLPNSIQVSNAEMFTALYWMGRWTLECAVQNEQYFIPSWNALSENNFENQSYARLVGRMCDAVNSQNIQQSQVRDAVVVPMLEMDVAIRWCNVPQQAEQILPTDYQNRAMKWKRDAEQLLQSSKQGGFGNQQRSNGFGNQQQSNGFGNQQQSSGWGNQRQGGFSQQKQISGTNKSGFFSGTQQAPSSTNSAGIRTTFSAGEAAASNLPTEAEQDKFTPRTSSSGWGGKSTQDIAEETQVTKGVNPLEDMLPQHEQWKVDDVVIPGSDAPIANGNLGDNTMTHSVSVSNALSSNNNGLSIDQIGCPVLLQLASECYGEFLPEGMSITGKDQENNVLVVANGQTDIPAIIIDAPGITARLAYDSKLTVLVEYIWADYDKSQILGKTVPVAIGEKDMDYFEHTLSSPVTTTKVKHHVEYASIAVPTSKANEAGMITKHGKLIDSSKVGYTSGEAVSIAAANIRVQTSTGDKSIETYDKLVLPFVVDKDFDLEILTKMQEYAIEADVSNYTEGLDALPRDMQLYIAYSVLSDVRYALDNILQAGINVGEFDDIGDMHQWLTDNRSDELAKKWSEVLTHILLNNVRVVPETMRITALEALGDAIPKTTDNLVLLERETYSLALPYTLSELNITAKDDSLFFVQDASHAKLHDVMKEVFTRLVKTNISDFQLRLADGCVYRICKLATVAKTYTFSKVK